MLWSYCIFLCSQWGNLTFCLCWTVALLYFSGFLFGSSLFFQIFTRFYWPCLSFLRYWITLLGFRINCSQLIPLIFSIFYSLEESCISYQWCHGYPCSTIRSAFWVTSHTCLQFSPFSSLSDPRKQIILVSSSLNIFLPQYSYGCFAWCWSFPCCREFG